MNRTNGMVADGWGATTNGSGERWLVALWLLLFLVPAALMQMGLLYFMRALWVIAPQLLRRVDAFEVARRVHER